jgi:hypothetical protein
MAQFMLIEKGKSPWTGVVICHGDDYQLWKAREEFYHEGSVSEGKAQLEGLKMQPGQMMPAEADEWAERMRDDYGIELTDETVQTRSGDVCTVVAYLRDYTLRLPKGWNGRADPFDIRNWT